MPTGNARRRTRTAEDRTHADRHLLFSIFERAGLGLCLLDPANRVILANSEWLTSSDLSLDDVLGKDYLALRGERYHFDHDFVADLLLRVRSGETVPLPLHVHDLDAGIHWFEGTLSPIPMPGGVGVLVSSHDVSARVQAQDEQDVLTANLKETILRLEVANRREQTLAGQAARQTRQLSAVLDGLLEGVTVADPDGRVLLMNRTGRRLWGLPEQEGPLAPEDYRHLVLQRPDGTALPFEDWPINRALRGEEFVDQEAVFLNAGGARRQLVFSGTAVWDEEGRVEMGVNVYRDITQLRYLMDLREEFISVISHDLRQPLTVILGLADWLRSSLRQKGLAAEAHSADVAARGAQRMNAMIQELVDSARMTQARPELDRETLDLRDFVAGVVEAVVPAEECPRVTLDVPEPVPPAWADPERLHRVLANLLGNALKYSPAGTPVVIHLACQQGSAVVSVIDRGVGIPPKDLPRIFERFYRSKSGEKKSDGLGLGLYISRLIVEAHGGRLSVESTPGVGSTFTFTLPLA